MTIDPEGKLKGLIMKWEVAAHDLPIPSQLMETKDQREWASYVDCLSPAQQLRKLAQALDQFHALIQKTSDPLTLSREDQIVLYSKWEAASIASCSLSRHFYFGAEEMERPGAFHSDISRQLFCIIDFLKSVSSPDVDAWEDRRKQHDQIDRNTFCPFLNQAKNLKAQNQKPPAGPAPKF